MPDPTPEAPSPQADPPGLKDLFLAFSGMALMGFGGVLPWARRMLVEQRRWLTGEEFTEAFSLGQFLPGANIVNMAVFIGRRFRGAPGAIVSVAGMMLGPVIVVSALGALYLRYADLPLVHDALNGVAVAAAGLILSMAAKMAQPLVHKGPGVAIGIALLTFVGGGLLRLPLPLVLLVLAPLSIALAWRRPQ